MLKKLNFDIKFFNYSQNEFNRDTYFALIDHIYNNSIIFTFKLNMPCYIHLIDTNNNTYYCDMLCLNSVNNDEVINESYLRFCCKLEEFIFNKQNLIVRNNDTFVMVYISEQCVLNIDTQHLYQLMKESEYELKKMYRDINWFDDKFKVNY